MDVIQDARHDDFLPSLDEIPTAADFVVDNDLSKGKEMNKLRVINTENKDTISPFEYITSRENGENVDLPCKIGPIVRPAARFQVFFKDCLIEWALQTLDDIDAGAPLFEYVGVLGRQKTVGTTADNDDYICAFEHNGQQYQLDALQKGERWWLSKACPCLCANEKCKYDGDWWANLVQNGTNLARDYGKQMACKSAKDGTAWGYGKQMACKSAKDGTNLAWGYGKQMACKSAKDGTNLAWGYGKQMACKSAKDGTNLAWGSGKQMACKTAAPLPLQRQRHTARKSVVTLPMTLSRIEVGPLLGNLPCVDMKLTGDQLAQLLNMD
ncbi:hypothetical protein niasHT_036984 [Heterodera trifolii]|uniref:Uncharacterized protein n=1 Tax=Heterodera trifolii TaxID=157864 RepID=A0ABD2IKV2_9BILA